MQEGSELISEIEWRQKLEHVMATEDRFYSRFFGRVFLGPTLGLLVGLGFYVLHRLLKDVHILDRVAYLMAYCGIGLFAGFVIGVLWAFGATKSPQGGGQ